MFANSGGALERREITVNDVELASKRLRTAVTDLRANVSRDEVVAILANWAKSWFAQDSEDRRAAKEIHGRFPYAMVKNNLDALLKSVTVEEIQSILLREEAGERRGAVLTGHVIAANTPLLAWSSILRALIMCSGALVKLSSTDEGAWTSLLISSLSRSCPELARCVEVLAWSGGEGELNNALYNCTDLLLVYGSDETISYFNRIAEQQKPVIGYGHRVSIGIADDGATEADAAGLAQDVVTYGQTGCLSPQVIFYIGSPYDLEDFSLKLAKHLAAVCDTIDCESPDLNTLHMVRTHTALARMAGCKILEDYNSRWTIVLAGNSSLCPPGCGGIVHIRAVDKLADILQWTQIYHGRLQGCAIASMRLLEHKPCDLEALFGQLDFSLVCRPGELQTPPISWRQDNRNVLRSLVTDLFS
jgi:hypothetical protein